MQDAPTLERRLALALIHGNELRDKLEAERQSKATWRLAAIIFLCSAVASCGLTIVMAVSS